MPPRPRPARPRPVPGARLARPRLLVAAAAALATVLSGLVVASPAQAENVVTPGNFTGYGFDQCQTPAQATMDAWLRHSPYWAVGIYIAGDSRFCRNQPNLTPTWVSTQLARGWRLLPITLGPQAWCTTRDRYKKQVRIDPAPASNYTAARKQGRDEAQKTVTTAEALGIAAGSTLWYDIEHFPIKDTNCRESVLNFLSAWTNKLHGLGYVSGVYSSASSGLKILDDARVNRPGTFVLPDQVWIADWNGRADVYSSFIRNDGWMPHARVHQYRGGHDETHGGVTVNIDSNWLDLGRGTVAAKEPAHCGGVNLDFAGYTFLGVGSRGALVKAAQCLYKEHGFYTGKVTGSYDQRTATAARAFRKAVGLPVKNSTTKAVWTALLSRGSVPLMKQGSGSPAVRRLQRALNAADGADLAVTGVFEARTRAAVVRYQRDHKLPATGVVWSPMWKLLRAGKR